MSDVLEVLKKAREALKTEGYTDLVSEIDEALEIPEMRIPVPKGNLLVGISSIDPEANQAFVCLDNEELGLVDLFLAECVNEDLRYPGEEEGDIRLRLWDDISNEDYTYEASITAKEIEEQEEYVRDRSEKE